MKTMKKSKLLIGSLLAFLSTAALASTVDFSHIQVKGDLSYPYLANVYMAFGANVSNYYVSNGIPLNQFQNSNKQVYVSAEKVKIANIGLAIYRASKPISWTPTTPPASCKVNLSPSQTLEVYGTLAVSNAAPQINITGCKVVS